MAMAGNRLQPPADWEQPNGLCACGCGKTTQVSKYSRPERGEYIGFHKRWVHGHHARSRLSKRGRENSGWKGGRCASKGGYILIHRPDHPSANRDGYVAEHRYVYETSRGITLPKNVIVHHVNGVKDDNRPENLIATTRSAHSKIHLRAASVIALFVDDRLLDAAKSHVRTHGSLPDLEALTAHVYGSDHAALNEAI